MIALGLVLTSAFAADMMTSERSATTQWASNLIGTTVKNLQGETLGAITDLTISNNIVTFAVISPGGALTIGDKLIPVPMNALKITDNKNATLDISKEKLATAPNYEKNSKKWPDFSNRKYAEDTYRFYGVELYWKANDMEHMKGKE